MGADGWVHFVGIGGVGMSGLAQLMLGHGYRVTGSDPKENQFTRRLTAGGAKIYHEHDPANILPGVQEVIISSAITPSNPEVKAANKLGLPVVKRGELLARYFNAQRGIAVAGAHGKTTTTAMVTLAIKEGGLEPTALVGGYVRELGGNVLFGKGPFFIAEADESDSSFLWLEPEIALVTNIEDDHLDHYGSLDGILAAFNAFIQRIRPGGKAILCTDDPLVKKLALNCSQKVITYGFNEGLNFRADKPELKGLGSQTRVYNDGKCLGTLTLAVPGKHNILNALGAVATAHQLGIPFDVAAAALQGFRGVGRRFEILWGSGDTWVVDDYAHHPTEVKATLTAANQVGARRVVAVFQPHRYTRTNYLYREFGRAFNHADIAVITDIYSAGEEPMPGVTSQLIIGELEKNGHQQVHYMPSLEETAAFVKDICMPGDLIITLGAGDIRKVGIELVKKLKARQVLSEMGA